MAVAVAATHSNPKNTGSSQVLVNYARRYNMLLVLASSAKQ